MRTHTRRFGIVLLSAAMLVPVGCAGNNDILGAGLGAGAGAGIAALAGGDVGTMLGGAALGGLTGKIVGDKVNEGEKEKANDGEVMVQTQETVEYTVDAQGNRTIVGGKGTETRTGTKVEKSKTVAPPK